MKAAVLALGASLKFYKPDGYDFTVGVNDIWSRKETDYVVCVDHMARFHPGRSRVISSCKPKKFLTSCKDWQHVENYEHFPLLQPSGTIDLDNNHVSYSNNSAFVAAVWAYKLGAKQIVLHGADFRGDHKYFANATARKRAVDDFAKLRDALSEKGVHMFVGNRYSNLNTVLPVMK